MSERSIDEGTWLTGVVVVVVVAWPISVLASSPGAHRPAVTNSAVASSTAATAGGHLRIPNIVMPR